MLYFLLNFENGLTIDALVDSGAYVSAIAQTELDRIKQQAPGNIFKIDDLPIFEIQVANGQLEKPISTATLKFDIGDNTFEEHSVVMKKLTGPTVGLHFMRHNSGVIDTTHDLILFPTPDNASQKCCNRTKQQNPNLSLSRTTQQYLR